MKTTGAQWNAYLESWPEGQWFDDSDETINGIDANAFDGDIPADAVVELTCGIVLSPDGVEFDLVRHLRKWLRAQKNDVLLCEVPKDKAAELAAFLKSIGGKLVKERV